MKKILVPYDFSEVSRHALNFACQIATKYKGKIHLLHVIEQPGEDSVKTLGVQEMDPMEQVYIKKLIDVTEKKLNEIINDAAFANEDITYNLRLGNAYKGVIQEVAESEADLMVVGTEGAEGLSEFFVGSYAEKIVRNAPCPVISLQNEANLDEIKKIVLASDFLHTPEAFIERVKRLQSYLGAELNIVKINTPASFTSTRHDMAQMEDFVEKHNIENCTIDIYNYKNEEDGIIFFAEDIEAEMIAIGTHQRKGIGHFLAGSIAEDIVNHSEIPVFTAFLD